MEAVNVWGFNRQDAENAKGFEVAGALDVSHTKIRRHEGFEVAGALRGRCGEYEYGNENGYDTDTDADVDPEK